MGKPKLEEEDAEMLGGLYEEIVEQILDRIPIRPLTRMKCLSKGWLRLISHYRKSRPICPASSIVLFHRYRYCDEGDLEHVDLLASKDASGGGEIETLVSKSLSFSIPDLLYAIETSVFPVHNQIQMALSCYGSCNGLLLWSSLTSVSNYPLQFLVSNANLNHWVYLPPLTLPHPKGTSVAGIAFHGDPHHQYKLVCFDFIVSETVATGYLGFQVFSSHTGTWTQHKARVLNLSLLSNVSDSGHSQHTYLFRKGWLHWVLHHCLLIYNVEDQGSFILIELPLLDKIEEDSYPHAPMLWESEGRLHYCYSHANKIHVLALNNDDIYTKGYKDTAEKWQLRTTILLEDLEAQHPDIFEGMSIAKAMLCFYPLSCCGFNEDLQILYVHFHVAIFTYSLETRRFDRAWTYKNRDYGCCRFCMQSTEISIPIGGGTQLLRPKTDSQMIAGRPRLMF